MKPDELADITDIARQLRVDSIRCSTQAGSGHPTSSLSAADVIAVLASRHLHYDWRQPKLATNDHLVFSKGHASPLLYSLFRAAGVVDEDELVSTYRQFGARLQGHPTPILPWVDLATGSLGLGITAAVGLALAGKRLDHLPYRVWVLCGDSEVAEGSVWEALDKAGLNGLDNFTAIIDANRLGQRGPTEFGWDLDVYARRVEAFGCHPIIVDGHDLEAIDEAFEDAQHTNAPSVIIARTIKGKGVPEVEDKEGWHGVALPADLAERAITALGGTSAFTLPVHVPHEAAPVRAPQHTDVVAPRYELGKAIATRRAFGDALAALAARPEVVALDAEVGNSTHAEEFLKVAPERYFEAFIAEQLMVGAAMGLAARGYIPYATTFGAFFSRAFDFVRMAGISGLHLRLVGSHAGVEIGADGPSQMALEDIASMRAVHGSIVLYPSDATATAALTIAMADAPGIAYLRTTRGAYPVIYAPEERFPIGEAKVVRASAHDDVTLVGAGVTLHESLAAADLLAADNITARVIDCYSIKPIDAATLVAACEATSGRIVVTEDHYPEGGIGEAVMGALIAARVAPQLAHLAVRALAGSGTPAELLDAAGISAVHIATEAERLVRA